MTLMITTAFDGPALREYAATKAGNKRIAIFPETGLSANEQAGFILEHGASYDEIVTFSTFIISDAQNGSLNILGNHRADGCSIRHGDSVNKVCMNLGRRSTIGDIAQAKIDQAYAVVRETKCPVQISSSIDSISHELGDSTEKILFLKFAYNKADSLTSDPANAASQAS